MLKRIVVFGDDEERFKSVTKIVNNGDFQVVKVRPGDEIPPRAAALIAGEDDLPGALDTIRVLAEEHEQILNMLAEAIDCRVSMSSGSSQRVRGYASGFAKAIGLDADQQSALERGALLRDIGKFTIPSYILMKSTPLTHDEWLLLQRHTHFGADMALKLHALRDAEDMIRRHHECYNGEGYPDGLKGNDIPLLARILKVIDVYCALTQKRHYRHKHYTRDEALDYLADERGKHFDPDLVDAFIKAKVRSR